jgi:hypothetical protein
MYWNWPDLVVHFALVSAGAWVAISSMPILMLVKTIFVQQQLRGFSLDRLKKLVDAEPGNLGEASWFGWPSQIMRTFQFQQFCSVVSEKLSRLTSLFSGILRVDSNGMKDMFVFPCSFFPDFSKQEWDKGEGTQGGFRPVIGACARFWDLQYYVQ